MSNPANTLPPEYDDLQPNYYDPAYTADISNKMRVPDRIEVDPPGAPHSDIDQTPNSSMTVPEKIIVAGQNQHYGAKHEPQLHLDHFISNSLNDHVSLLTPPRVLSLNERNFPENDEEHNQINYSTSDENSLHHGNFSDTVRKSDIKKFRDNYGAGGDSAHLQSQQELTANMFDRLKRIEKEIGCLQDENEKFKQREIIVYSIFAGYFILKCCKWIFSQ